MNGRYIYEPRQGHGLAHNPIASIVGPRPIAWISTVGADGRQNLAPYSFFGIFNYTPPIVAFSSDGIKDTLRNCLERGEFVVNVVTEELAEAMNLSSASCTGSEFELAGLDSAPSHCITTPRVARSPVALECKVIEHMPLKDKSGQLASGHLLTAEVVCVSIEDRHVCDGAFSWGAVRTIVRAGGLADYHWIGRDNLTRMQRPR